MSCPPYPSLVVALRTAHEERRQAEHQRIERMRAAVHDLDEPPEFSEEEIEALRRRLRAVN